MLGGAARARLASGAEARVGRWVMGIAALPTCASLASEWVLRYTPPNAVRALCGLSLGAGIAWVLLAAASSRTHSK
jgi:hypothetical protein